jgi:hypothetical protein
MLARGAHMLGEHGIAVYNCSPVSDIEGFRHVTYEYALSL